MPSICRRALVVAACAAFAASIAAGEAPRGTRNVVFGLIAPQSQQQSKEAWTPFAERLGAAIGATVELRAYSGQADLASAFRRGEIDLGWMGNGPALEVVESGAGSVFAQGVTKDGSFGYKSILVVPSTSTLTSLADVLAQSRKLRFGDGDPKSTSGHLVPSYYAFQKNGVENIGAIFKTVSTGNQQKNLTMAAKSEVDVATSNNEELRFFTRDFPELAKQVRVIWESPMIPQSPLLWKSTLASELRRKVLAFTNGFGKNAEETGIVERIGYSRFRQSSNGQLIMIADLEMFKARQAINNDASLSADERARRIDEVIRRASRLDLMLKLSSVSMK